MWNILYRSWILGTTSSRSRPMTILLLQIVCNSTLIYNFKIDRWVKIRYQLLISTRLSKPRLDFIVNSKNEVSPTISQRRSELFKNHSRVILRVNRLSKFNDRDENLKVIRFLIQFNLNIYNYIQSFITMINLNDTNRHVVYLIYIMLIVYWLDREHSISDAMIVISKARSEKFMWHLVYVCELLFKIYFNSLQMKSI